MNFDRIWQFRIKWSCCAAGLVDFSVVAKLLTACTPLRKHTMYCCWWYENRVPAMHHAAGVDQKTKFPVQHCCNLMQSRNNITLRAAEGAMMQQ
jgi:hypothetical protein